MASNKTIYSTQEIYDKYVNLVEPRLSEIELMLFEGKTFSQIADELGVSNSLLWQMRISKNFTGVRDVFKSKETTALRNENVENALYRKAVGYFVEEEQLVKVKTEYYNKMDRKCTREDYKKIAVKKYIPPDFNAQRFYLLNMENTRYHAETQKPEDNSTEQLIDNVKNVLVKVRNLANDQAPRPIEHGDNEDAN